MSNISDVSSLTAAATRELAQDAVVVGVDQTSASDSAVRWAAAEACSLGTRLAVVNVWNWESAMPWPGSVGSLTQEELAQLSAATASRQAQAARNAVPELAVDAASMNGTADDLLVQSSLHASTLVIGSHQRGTVARIALGSVGHRVMAQARCPVVSVCARRHAISNDPAVIVGISGDQHDAALMEFALNYARRHSLRVSLLHCWTAGPMHRQTPRPPVSATEWMSSYADYWRGRHPNVRLSADVLCDHAVGGLVDAAAGHALLVVGRRSPRLRPTEQIGSVSLGVLHHADCAVAVIPPAS